LQIILKGWFGGVLVMPM